MSFCDENCFVFWYPSPFASSLSFFSCFLPLSILLAKDGDDGTGWIFNRFVSGSTMGGGIVVNIITYRSLRLHFPRPCQTGAITHNSQPLHHTYTYTHMHPSLMAASDRVCLRHFTMSISYDPFNPPCILCLCNSVFHSPCLLKQAICMGNSMTPAWIDVLYISNSKDGCCFVRADLCLCTEVWWPCPEASIPECRWM